MTSFRKVQILTKRIVNSKGVPQRPQRTEAIHYFGVTVSSRGCCFDLGAHAAAAVAGGGLYQARGAEPDPHSQVLRRAQSLKREEEGIWKDYFLDSLSRLVQSNESHIVV